MQYLIKIWTTLYGKQTYGRKRCKLHNNAFADANIALKKPTKLSSIFDPRISQQSEYLCCNSTYVVDGDKSSLLANGDFLCAHSDSLANQQSWWAVDLQNVYIINNVDIFGRTDCCTHQLANFDVEVILPTCTNSHWNYLEEGCKMNCHYQSTESQRITVTCPPNTKGRDKDVFERVLKFYDGSCIHIPHNVCSVEFVEELKFWGINPISSSPCCFLKYKQQAAENALLHTYMKDQKEEKVDTLSTRTSKFQKLRLYGRHILEINRKCILCRVYFVLSTFCILLSVLRIAISTLPEFRRIDSDTNYPEQDCVCFCFSDDNNSKLTSSNVQFLSDNEVIEQATDSAN
ncbi:unnamed protein product [Mytilus coruscus]|uniref:Fucolectin tachylectin-4 pentraxin-1 domain-containing protein n=1 Tax=Mytilus coruscus TaxID=42192 RepID=A0A6J8F1A0_MYTCO|nr:unnamed protein product [Mytilus coruscus]